MERAEEYAAILYGCYRRTDADSPEIFLSAAVTVLCGYPESIARAVCDPRSGLPAKLKFPPNIFELTEACDAKMRPLLDEKRRRRLREELEADAPAPVSEGDAERRRAVVAAYRAKQALQEATTAGVETPLESLDARKLQGEHREMVKAALETKIARLAAASQTTPLKLSAACLSTEVCRSPVSNTQAAE
jgi:predicted DNA-binding WGR domain protein